MNNKRKTIRWFLKLIFSGILSGLIVSAFAWFYYNPPVHVPSDEMLTDYKREPEMRWSRGIEGFASGKMDANGYNNAVAADEPVDVLFMGSSQTEGLYVKTAESYPHHLLEKLNDAGLNLSGYNIGMSSHTIFKNIRNLPNALEKYHPKYLILEDITMNFSDEAVDKTLNNEIPRLTAYSEKDIRFLVQKNPFVKLLYLQYKNFKKQADDDGAEEATGPNESLEGADRLLTYLEELAQEYDCRIIILYIPTIHPDAEKKQVCEENEIVTVFSEKCMQHAITFKNMGQDFNREFQENYIVPSGFSNTRVAYGHLNREGHRIITDSLFETIRTMEKEGER